MMKEKTWKILSWVFGVIAFFIIAIPIAFTLLIFFDSQQKYKNRHEAIEGMAELWDIDIDTEIGFPIGYLNSTFDTNSTVSDVHAVMKEYEKVLHCGFYSEIYYFTSEDADDALRIQVHYDKDGYFRSLHGEDVNSSTIRTRGCEPGLIEEE